jgi:hypothetical protein
MTLFAGLLHSVRNDGAHVSVIANPKGEAIRKAEELPRRDAINRVSTCPVLIYAVFPFSPELRSASLHLQGVIHIKHLRCFPFISCSAQALCRDAKFCVSTYPVLPFILSPVHI